MKRQFLGVQEGVWAWQQLRRRKVSRLPRGSGSTEPWGVPLGAGPDSPEGQARPSPGVCPWGQVLRLPRGPGSTEPWGVPLGAGPQTPQRARLHRALGCAPGGKSSDSPEGQAPPGGAPGQVSRLPDSADSAPSPATLTTYNCCKDPQEPS